MEQTDTLLHNPSTNFLRENQLCIEYTQVTFPSFPRIVETFTPQGEALREPLLEFGTILAAPGVSVTNFDGQQRVMQPGVNGNTEHGFDTQTLNSAAQRTAEKIHWDTNKSFHLLEFGLVRKATTDATKPRNQSFLVVNRCGRNCEADHGVSNQLASYHSGVYVINEAIDERIQQKFNSIEEFNSKLLEHIYRQNHEFYHVHNRQLVQSGSWTRIIPPEAVVNGMLDILGIDIRALARSTAPQDLALKNAVQELFATLSSTEVGGQKSADGTITLDYALTPVRVKDTDGNSTGWTLLTSRGDLYFNSITNWTPEDTFVQQEAYSFNQLLTQGHLVVPATMEHNASLTSQRRKEFEVQTTVVEHQPGSRRTLVFEDGVIQVQLEIHSENGVQNEVIEFQQETAPHEPDVTLLTGVSTQVYVPGDVTFFHFPEVTLDYSSTISLGIQNTLDVGNNSVHNEHASSPIEISQTTPPPPPTVLLQVTAGLPPRQQKQPSQQQPAQARPTDEQQPVSQFLVTNPSDSPAPPSPTLSNRLRVPGGTIALGRSNEHNITRTDSTNRKDSQSPTRTNSSAQHQASTTSQAGTNEIERTKSENANQTAPNTHSSVETSAESRRRSSQSVQTSEGTDSRKAASQHTTQQQGRQSLRLLSPRIDIKPFHQAREPKTQASAVTNIHRRNSENRTTRRQPTPIQRSSAGKPRTSPVQQAVTNQFVSTESIIPHGNYAWLLSRAGMLSYHSQTLTAHAQTLSAEEQQLINSGYTPFQIQQILLERRSGRAA
ncbi:MAG: hypothetical protein ACOCXT_06030 [Candidatus Dojkabacteria bacterium]